MFLPIATAANHFRSPIPSIGVFLFRFRVRRVKALFVFRLDALRLEHDNANAAR